jgi:predicted transposase YbfD/YdcC
MPETTSARSLRDHFATLPDPRIDRTKRHLLVDILFITLAALLAGAEDCVSIADFARTKQPFFAQWLELPNGIPSHDTFNRVLARLDPDALNRCFLEWVKPIRHRLSAHKAATADPEIVALDGKQLRGSKDRADGQKAVTLVSAWATSLRLALGQVAVSDKSNEITALPELLAMLDLAGCIVTVDAMGTQKAIARQITAQEADYVLALKDNHPNLAADVALCFEHALRQKGPEPPCLSFVEHDYAHGRKEQRRYWLLELPEGLAWQDEKAEWAGLVSIGRVEAQRTTATGTSCEVRYFLTSLPAKTDRDVRLFGRAVRRHWGIENRLHWVLDIAFREDGCRLRKDHAAQNVAVIRHIALNLLRQDKVTKMGIKNRRLKAGWDEDYLLSLLAD